MANTTNSSAISVAIIPAALMKNGTFFHNWYITTFDPYLSANPFPLHSDDALLSGLEIYCNFTLLDNLPSNFDIQYDVNMEKWVQLVNPLPISSSKPLMFSLLLVTFSFILSLE
ncbi:hypothetical protein BDN71DRAFT_1508537 [Pleurotus eryngii]|uniref:Uncharacterized protein n=1 Tax=Pleurotus eryngii TaxID=5323 RepID=A0A9P5ZS34_PLEER|nr:hypothetical protein BDN71DRAFT_1508537 [Pleurotus eryngii]